MDKNYYTRAEAEQLLELSSSTVKRLLQSGILYGWKEPGQSGTGDVWCIDKKSVHKYAVENDIFLNNIENDNRPNYNSSRQPTIDRNIVDCSDSGRQKNNEYAENKEESYLSDSRQKSNSIDKTVNNNRQNQDYSRSNDKLQSTVKNSSNRELQAENILLKKKFELLEKQFKIESEELKKDKCFLKEQLERKDDAIHQQNAIIMATQKNMNDLLQHHNELQFSHAKKEDLIKQLEYDRSKTESTIKSISKLERLIDDTLITKRLKDGIDFSNQLLKEKKKK